LFGERVVAGGLRSNVRSPAFRRAASFGVRRRVPRINRLTGARLQPRVEPSRFRDATNKGTPTAQHVKQDAGMPGSAAPLCRNAPAGRLINRPLTPAALDPTPASDVPVRECTTSNPPCYYSPKCKLHRPPLAPPAGIQFSNRFRTIATSTREAPTQRIRGRALPSPNQPGSKSNASTTNQKPAKNNQSPPTTNRKTLDKKSKIARF
jgi:hypothetical protein